MGTAYKIDNSGITHQLQVNTSMPEPNTKGYATGAEYETGISIEVLDAPGASMRVQITLEEVVVAPTPAPVVEYVPITLGIHFDNWPVGK